MKAEIITIGDEIIIGQVTDTNSSFIAEELNKIGIEIMRITSVPDNRDSITDALDNSKKEADIVIMTGGLGPTGDDITKNTLAEYFHSKLVINQFNKKWKINHLNFEVWLELINQVIEEKGLNIKFLRHVRSKRNPAGKRLRSLKNYYKRYKTIQGWKYETD